MPLETLSAALGGLTVASALFGLVWIGSFRRNDASLVDRFWGLGFVAVAGWYLLTAPERPGGVGLLVGALVAIWGIRLSWHLSRRNWGKGEDYRYRAMRERHGSGFRWRSLATVFLLQAAILWLVSLPLLVAIRGAPRWSSPWVWLGLALWLVGFWFEARGDFELARFKAEPGNRGRVLDRGLWRYTRHPNYFGDATLWWGFYCFAVAAGGAWTVGSPLLMTVLLLRVSGVVLLERKLVETRPEYRAYVERTSAFVPRPPRR